MWWIQPPIALGKELPVGLEERERLDFQLGEFPPSPAVPLGQHLLSEHVGRQYGRGVINLSRASVIRERGLRDHDWPEIRGP